MIQLRILRGEDYLGLSRWALNAIMCVIRGRKKEAWHRQEKAMRRWWRNGEVAREEMPATPINFQIVELEKTLVSPLDSKEIKPVNPKGDQPWIFIGRNDAEAEAPILWPLDTNSLLLGKDPDAVKDWGQGEKRVTENEMVGCHTSLSFTISQNLLKLMSFVSVMPSNHLVLCHPLLPLPSVFLSIRVFSQE